MSSDPGIEDGGGGGGGGGIQFVIIKGVWRHTPRHIHARNLRLTFAQCGSIASTENHDLYCGQHAT